MNNPSPLVPQGSLQQARGKSKLRVAVFSILAVHVFVLSGLLMQGCKRGANTAGNSETNSLPQLGSTGASPETNLFANTPAHDATAISTQNTLSTTGSLPNSSPSLTSLQPSNQTPVLGNDSGTAPMVATTAAKEYAVASGDTLGTIAKKHGISLKALQNANPAVIPERLRVGQKIQIPAVEMAQTSSTTGTHALVRNGDSISYTVKNGDSLTKIAKQYGTTPKALRASNNMKTDQIKVGQKLKIPSKTIEAASTASNGTALGQP